MFAFVLRRLIQAVIVMVAVAFIAFLLFQYVGDPVVFLLGQDATPEQMRELRADAGPRQALLRAVLALPRRTPRKASSASACARAPRCRG